MFKRTKIIATVGPVSSSRETLCALVAAGVDVFRINFSHGDERQRQQFLDDIRAVEAELGSPVAVCGDLCGPKIRVGVMHGGEIQLHADQQIVIQRAAIEGTCERISTTLPELVDVVQTGDAILLVDGRLRFEVTATSPPEEFTCRVVVGGTLSSGKGVNVPHSNLSIASLTEKDRRDLEWIAARDFDFVALSFVRSAEDVVELRGLLDNRGSTAQIIAKIEKPQALAQIDAIIQATDAVMVARGDLGVEMDFPTVPIAQKSIAAKCQMAGKPCIIATEMLESMVHSPRPTRAEVSDVANAVFDHADAVMLSAESSVGEYPVEAVTAMRRTVLAAETFEADYGGLGGVTITEPQTTAALAASILKIMDMQSIAAIAVFTASGRTARLIAKNRPNCPVLAMSANRGTMRRCCLYFGVIPHEVEYIQDGLELLARSVAVSKNLGIASPGDRIIVLAGHPIGSRDGTNGLVVQVVE